MKEHYLFWQFFMEEYLSSSRDTGELDPCDIRELVCDIREFYYAMIIYDYGQVVEMRRKAQKEEEE